MTITSEPQSTLAETIFAGGSEMGALMRSHDWSQSVLGPVETWSQSLKTGIQIILGSRYPMFIWWGQDLINFYNDAYIPMLGKRHPKALGESASDIWSEIWHILSPLADDVLERGTPSWNEEFLEIMERNGYREETYFTFSYSPISTDDGGVGGIFCACTEDTRRVLDDRRLRTLRELGVETAHAKTVDEACQISATVLANNPRDIPFALIYRLDKDRQQAQLASTANLAINTTVSPSIIELSRISETSDCWSLNSILAAGEIRVIDHLIDRFGALPGGAWDESPNSAIVLPLTRPGQELGVLIAGISPYRPLDDDYRGFFDLVAGQVTTAIANTLADEEERKRAEALRKSEEKYRTLLDSIDEGYCVIEMHIEPGEPLDYRFIETNQAFEQQSTLINAQGKWMRELRPDHEESWFEIYRDVALTGKPTRFEHGGRELENRWFTLYAFRVGQPDERRVGVLFYDVTERKQAEQAKTVFLSNVSHELRTPLTLLLGPLQDVLSDTTHSLAPLQQECLELAQQNAIRLLKLVNTLLDFSRIESDRLSAVYEPTDLATFTAELASVFRSAIEQANLRFIVDCPPLPEPVYVDREMWEKIVLNLISNAFKFTFTGEITVKLHLVSDWVELAVKDTGIGIPAAEIPHLFERFYRVKGAQGRTFEGSGIGLSLVQELVKLHGGTIQASSVEGEGSCFTVSIPLGSAHLPQAQIKATQTLTSTATKAISYLEEALRWLPEEGVREKSSTRPQPLAPSSSSARILLVDDNADMRDYLRQLLSQHWQVETAANGAIALATIQNKPPDLVLSDVMMPELDGFQLLHALRSDPQTKSIPVILLSARAGEEAAIEGLEAGADDYLIKPFSTRELMARINTQLQISLLRQERSTNRFKNEFLMTVTHELQAPLAAILAWTRLLQSQPFDFSRAANALATIERNAMVEAKLVKDLLDVASILAGKYQLQPQSVDLVAVIKKVVAMLRPTAQAKQIHLVEVLPATAIAVFGERDRLEQVITNLLSNAIKFTPSEGQVEVKLEKVIGNSLSVIDKDSNQLPMTTYAQIQITDTGIGISPDFLPYVFDRFSQAEVPSRHSPGGVGIGLAIARLLVELHHGTIEVASEEGQGATFSVRLPLINADAQGWE